MRRELTTVLVIAIALISIGARPAKLMYYPPSIRIPEKASMEAVSAVIHKALLHRGWTVDAKKFPDGKQNGSNEIGILVSTLHIRTHTVTIKITVDAEKIKIEYVRSTQMQFREESGTRYIHPKYTQWIKNLEKSIRSDLLKLL